MNQLPIGSLVHGFRVERGGEVPYLNASYLKLTHEETGATVYYSDRDDGQFIFSVGFRTLPEDDTGVFHILEHSCLDGSEHFRLKEPFVNLLKTSMAVDLNAMTYEDKTIYYFISTNEQDYQNLMSVYLDAVFHPLLLSDRRIFEKEAWHLEPDGQGGVSISGVVFNEMQGNDNQPAYAMWMQNEKQLFPDLFFRFNSGGDPASIPNLSYEQFVDTYNRFYSTENAIFYLSGALNLPDRLAYIDEILRAKGKPDRAKPAPAPLQAPVVSPDGTVCYQLGDNEALSGNTHLMLTYVLEDGKPEDVLATSLLCRYLAENTESPLTRAVLDAGVGRDFDMACEGDYRQPMLYFTLGKSDPECADGFRKAILDKLTALVDEGLDAGRIAALVESHETDCRRASLSVRTGFRIMEFFLRAHVQHDNAEPTDDLARLRAAMAADEHYFENLIRRSVLNSNHWAMTRCVPSRTLTAERRARMSERFAAESARVAATEGGYAALEAHMEAFNAYLTAPDSPEAEASVPHLTPADLKLESDHRDMVAETRPVGGTAATSLSFVTDASGMVMAGLLFDLAGLAESDVFYARALADAVMSLPTATHTLPELSEKWVGLHTNPAVAVRGEATGHAYLSLSLDAPEERLDGAARLLGEYIREVVFDRDVLRQIFSNASGVRNRMIAQGNVTALRLATRALHPSGMYDDLLNGESAYRRLCDLADRFDASADALIDGMTRVWNQLMTSVEPLAYYTGSAAGYAAWCEAVAALPVAAAVVPPKAPALTLAPREACALTIPGEVNYCAETFDITEAGLAYSPRYTVINNLLYSRFFWDEIRAKGGAYGANAFLMRNGIAGFLSYRDPRVADTYAVYDALPDWLEENIPDEDAIGAMIVSNVGANYFAPRSPIDLGMAALSRYLVGMTAADREAEIADILATTAADFATYAAAIRTLKANGRGLRTIVGGAESIAKSGLFPESTVKEL